MGLILGLDLGITSVGFAVINDKYEIQRYGVRLFEESNADNNLKRRTMRSGRRLKSRRKNRIKAVKYLLVKEGIIENINFPILTNVYELRVKGLTQKLSNVELANCLVNIAKHRGSSLDVVIDEDDKESGAMYSALQANGKELLAKDWYVCQSQFNKIQNGIKLRNHDNMYKTSDYEKEVRKILSNQDIEDAVKEKIVEIVVRRRHFSEGPGSYKFPTMYGSYRFDDNGEIVKVNLIDEMRGKCSLFPEEPRIAKNTYKACLFNLLNDLNNITYVKDGENKKITPEQKKEIIEKYVNVKGAFSVADLKKYLGVDEKAISGLKKDKSDKPIITTFDIFKKILKLGLPKEVTDNHDLIDLIIEEFTKSLVAEERMNFLDGLNLNLLQEQKESLRNLTKINGYHSLSAKAMDLLMPELLNSSRNQMQIIYDNNLGNNIDISKGKNIEFDKSSILSPVAKRVHQQAIKVVNALRKEFGEFDKIVIETTRDKNLQDERKRILEEQKRNEKIKEESNNLVIDQGFNPNDLNTLTKLKLRLYKEQHAKTIYAGLDIDLNTLVNDPTAYQIEHIIPYAISFDNSLSNKALASHKENQLKGRMTPWEYFSSGKAFGPIDTFEKYEAFVQSLGLNKNKLKNLLNQNDVSKFENMQEFRARNLVDTSYGIRTVMDTLKKYFKINNIDTSVFTVKGKITHDFRSRTGLEKNRDNYIHHAIDALIIAALHNQKVVNFLQNTEFVDGSSFNKYTGELREESPLEDQNLIRFVRDLKTQSDDEFHFSYKVDTKTNRQFSDETIYSTRKYDDGEYVIKKYKDIYGPEGESLKGLFTKNKSQDLLMYRNDIQTYEIFKKIVDAYPNSKNPFAAYKEEHGPIRKYAKDGNGPVISQVKYKSGKLGSHLSITSKYENCKDKNVVLLQTTPYRTDIYMNQDGLYKFVTVKRFHIYQKGDKNFIDKDTYESLLLNKKIDSSYEFKFSLNRNNIVFMNVDGIEKRYRFVGTNSDENNVLEFKLINMKSKDRCFESIGKKVKNITKYNVSVTGKYQKVEKEDLKLSW